MTTPLLTTKLYIPPTRPEFVSRPRLIERLSEGLHRKLTLVSAPAGFGKTTLVSDWLRQLDVPIAWVSLDESDNDPVRFLTYFVAALQTIEARQEPAGDIGQGALGMLQSPQLPPTEAVLTSLINDIAAIPDRFVLVLDDYHLIETQPIHDALTFLLEHLPPQMHLVIASRDNPLLPLPRLRARGQLTELRATDLRFASSEASEFLNQAMGLNLSAEDIAALETRTEGWIAGLQLAAISMQGHEDATRFIKSFTGSHHFVLDYLLEEVLHQQPESIQTFLLHTSILDRLTGSLCDAVLSLGAGERGSKGEFSPAPLPPSPPAHRPSASGQETLEYLQHANLFIVSLDEERRWYRYHHLFADLLRQRLPQKLPDRVPMLHIRASEWYEQNGFADEAIEHALRGEDFERAAHLIEEQAEAVWGRGEETKLGRWLDGLPPELVLTKPQLCIFHAWKLFTRGQQDAAEQSLQAAEKALGPSTDLATETSPIERDQRSEPDRMKIQGRAAAIRAFLAFFRGDVPGIIQFARQALEFLPEQDLTWRSTVAIALGDAHSIKGEMVAAYQAQSEALEACKVAGDIYLVMLTNLKVATTLRSQGRLQRTIEICRQQMQLANEYGLSQTGLVGWLLAIWGEVLAELNDLAGAIDKARKGVELAERSEILAGIGRSYGCLTRILFSSGDLASAEEIIQKIENIARESDVPPWITVQMAAWQARLWLAQDKLEAASQWVRQRELYADGESTLFHEIDYITLIEYVTLARIFIAQGQLDETSRLLQHLLEAAETGGRTTRVIEILILQALALQAQGDTDQAITRLEQALTIAEPGGFIRIFVDEGPPMADLLQLAMSRKITPGYTSRLLAARQAEQGKLTTQGEAQPLVEPLTERELEILNLIAAGLSNKVIAETLFITVGTVKRHSMNIYGKLGVNSRTQATVKARELNLIE
jgi:LuxR family maltose regulon positive regulatory protein